MFEGVGCFEHEYDIKLKPNAQPVAHPPRKVPQAIRNRLREKLNELVKRRIIEEVKANEFSSWVSHLVTVEKKNKERSLRLCIDPQELNRHIADEHAYIPTFDDLSSKLANMKYFSV